MHKKMIIAVTWFQNFTLSQREEKCKVAARKALLSQSHASSLGFLLGSLRGRHSGDSVRGRGHRAITGPGVAAVPQPLQLELGSSLGKDHNFSPFYLHFT